jgi:stage V sporulation protein SpoVS
MNVGATSKIVCRQFLAMFGQDLAVHPKFKELARQVGVTLQYSNMTTEEKTHN